MAFDISTAKPFVSGGFDISTAKPVDEAPQQAEAPQEQTQQRVVALGGGRSGRGQRLRQERERNEQLLSSFEAGEITSEDLTEREIESVRKGRIDKIPEITGSFKQLSDNLGVVQGLAGLTAFDPDEFGRILTQADPKIGIVTTPDGERIAINRETNDAFSINKLGPSLMDAVQLGGTVAAFTPAGKAASLVGIALGSAATQAGIETGQAFAGGEFNPEQVVLAGAAAPIVAKTLQGATAAIGGLRKSLKIPTAETRTGVAAPVNLSLEPIESVAPRRGPLFGNESPTKMAIKEAIERSEGDNITAKYIIDGAGKVRTDPIARQAIKQGFDEGTVAAVKGSSPLDKQAFNKMLDIVHKGKANKTFASKFRPSDVVGDSLVKRFTVVNAVNKQAGKELDGVAKGLQGTRADINQPVGKFLDDLDDLGVSFADDGAPVFTDSSIEGSTGAENLINKVWPRLKRLQENPDALTAHRLKRFIDTQVEFGKISKDGLTNETANVVKGLRRNINEVLRELSPKYKEVNTRYSETKDVLDGFQSAAGKSINLLSENADKQLGVLSRRLLSNVQSRVKLMDSISELEKVGTKFGGKFDDDIFTQVMFVDELENHFKTFAPTSLQGVTEKAIKQGAQSVRGGLTDIGISAGAKVAEKARGINEANALKSLRALVNKP